MKTVTVYGLTAGTGKTSVAKEMAGFIQQRGTKTLLVDMDLIKGNITETLGLENKPNIGSWLMEIFERMDVSSCWDILYTHEEIYPYLQLHQTGLNVLTSNTEKNICHSSQLLSGLDIILRSLSKSNYDVVIFDTNNEVRDYTLDLMLRVDKVLLVIEPFRFSLQNAEMALRLLIDEGFYKDKFAIVFNRFPTFAEDDPEVISQKLGIPLYGVLPNYPELSGKKSRTRILTTERASRFSEEMERILAKIME